MNGQVNVVVAGGELEAGLAGLGATAVAEG